MLVSVVQGYNSVTFSVLVLSVVCQYTLVFEKDLSKFESHRDLMGGASASFDSKMKIHVIEEENLNAP